MLPGIGAHDLVVDDALTLPDIVGKRLDAR
jgi:hypothetical protein